MIINSECLKAMREMPDNSVDSIVTDPPYGLNFPYKSYDDSRENLIKLINDFMPQFLRISNRLVMIMCGTTQIDLYPQADWVCSVTWKTTGSFGKFGYSQWMPVLMYGKDLKGFGNVNGVTKSDTIKLSGGGGVGFTRSKEEKEHTCPKPMTIMNALIERYTMEGGKVLDPFMGVGSTGVACINKGREFIGIEMDFDYCKIAEARIECAEKEQLELI